MQERQSCLPVTTASITAVVVGNVLMGRFNVEDDVAQQLPLVDQCGFKVAPLEPQTFVRFKGYGDVEHLLTLTCWQ